MYFTGGRVALDHVVGMAVGQDQIDGAVVVVIEELQSPAAEQARRLGDAVGVRDVAEGLVLLVAVEREHLLIDVGDEEVLVAAAEDVGRIHAHAGARLAAVAEGDFGGQRDLLEFPSARCRRAAIHVEEILHRVVGDEQVHPAVVIDVRGDHAEALAERLARYRCPRATSVNVPSPLL